MSKTDRAKKKRALSGKAQDTISCYLLLLLPIIGFLLFNIYPLLWQIQKAFYRYNGVPSYTKYVGVKNFITIFTEDIPFWKS